MKLAVIAVGTEITEGRIANTNAAWISKRFLRLGIETTLHLAVPDDPVEMSRAFVYATTRATLVLVTGGLGPTVDDITRDVAADLAGVKLVEHAESLARVEMIFQMLGRSLTPNNKRQALFPETAIVIQNDHGTAPGFDMQLAGTRFIFLPGVPHESEKMLEEQVLPGLECQLRMLGIAVPVVRRLNCFGLAESKVDALLAPLFPGPDPQLAFNVSEGIVQIYLTARAKDRGEAAARLEEGAARVRDTLGASVFGEGEKGLEEVLLDLLRERGLTVALAESCTGGLAASRLVKVPGASDVFRGGVVAYSNDLKTSLLGVPAELIAKHGAVSREVAAAMAAGARRATGASLAAAITGIAGPSGGTAEKPVGLVYIAVCGDSVEHVREAKLGRERSFIQRLSALGALDLVRRAILGKIS